MVKFYALRIKGTQWYKSSGSTFESFDAAIGCGVYYNQLKTAEKNLKTYTKMYKGGNPAYPRGQRFTTPNESGDGWNYFYADQKIAVDEASYKVEFWDIELEIVELVLTKLESI